MDRHKREILENTKKETREIWRNAKEDACQIYKEIKLHPLIYSIGLIALVFASWLLFALPKQQVSSFGINNTTTVATLENQYRVTLAQIIGGAAVLLSLYFTWGQLKNSKEKEITERLTRAIEQLGNDNIQVRIAGINNLGIILNESENNYWPIIKILMVYIKTKSPSCLSIDKIEKDIQEALDIIKKRKYSYGSKEPDHLDLHDTFLEGADLYKANLQNAHLQKVNFKNANLEEADFLFARLQEADFRVANLKKAKLGATDLKKANFENANLTGVSFDGANLKDAIFEKADIKDASFIGVEGLTRSQISKASSVSTAKFDKGF